MTNPHPQPITEAEDKFQAWWDANDHPSPKVLHREAFMAGMKEGRCPYVSSSSEGTHYCRLAEEGQKRTEYLEKQAVLDLKEASEMAKELKAARAVVEAIKANYTLMPGESHTMHDDLAEALIAYDQSKSVQESQEGNI